MASRKTLPSFTRRVRPDANPTPEEPPAPQESASSSDASPTVAENPPMASALPHPPTTSLFSASDAVPPWRRPAPWRKTGGPRDEMTRVYEPSWRSYEAPRPDTPRARALTPPVAEGSQPETPCAPAAVDMLPSSMLWANQSGPEPAVTHPADAKVASQGSFATKVITSPNQDWVPQHPVERAVIRTYANGLWGYHEYSRWPQPLTPNMYHVACIPRPRSDDALPPILWVTLQRDTDWVRSTDVALHAVGFLKEHICDALSFAASQAIDRFDSTVGGPDHLRAYGQEVRLVLRQCVDCVRRLPAPAGVAIALGAHIQRLSLELHGIQTYLREVLPRMQDGADYSRLVLRVLGAFVHDEATALRCAKAGLPTWLGQPLTRKIKVWRVVSAEQPPYMCADLSSPPLEYAADEVAGVVNNSESWLSRMVFAISRQLCSAVLPALSDSRPMVSKGIVMVEAPPPSSTERPQTKKKTRRSGKKSKHANNGAATPTRAPEESSAHVLPAHAPLHADTHGEPAGGPPPTGQPSREFAESAFYRVPLAWRLCLTQLGSLPQPAVSVVYFYPPPFLLDTISSETPQPEPYHTCQVRRDEKVHQYIHNLVRIRAFCRWRLLDPTVSGRPLTIAEWRTALWGDYHVQSAPPTARTAGGQHRANKKFAAKSSIARLCANSAAMTSYDPSEVHRLAGLAVSKETAARNSKVRVTLCWESHEINFRAEALALDALMVPRDKWPVMHRWAREARVSEIWGPPSSLLTVVPDVPADIRRPWWISAFEANWKDGEPRLRAFVDVMSQWAGFPQELLKKLHQSVWSQDEYEWVQTEAVQFYVATFVSKYHRLPVPPMDFPYDFSIMNFPDMYDS